MCSSDLDEQLAYRQSEAHDGTRIGDELRLRATAELQSEKHGCEGDDQKGRWRCYSDRSWH